MIRALYTAASGMSAQQTNLDTIANNLANSATTGAILTKLGRAPTTYMTFKAAALYLSRNSEVRRRTTSVHLSAFACRVRKDSLGRQRPGGAVDPGVAAPPSPRGEWLQVRGPET